MTIVVRSNEKPAPEIKAPPSGTESQGGPSNDTPSAPAHETAEQKQESLESETEETEVKKESESESPPKTDDDPEEEAQKDELNEKDEKDEKPKKKGGFQRRIDKLNARHAQAQAELEYWKEQAIKSAQKTQSPESETLAQKKPLSFSSDQKPSPDHFDTHSAYVEALTDWKTEQKLKERDQKAERNRLETEQAKLVSTYVERKNAFSEKTPNFDEVIGEVDDIPVSATVRDMILSSDHGPELAYELAKNRDEYARVCKLPPVSAAREIGKIEARLTSKASADKKTDPKKITHAPKPLNPVGAGGKGSASKSLFDPNLSQAEYERLRMEQIKKRRQA